MARALENIRVIDMTVALAGPFCSQQLAAMGAEVIAIDQPSGGYQEKNFGKYPPQFKRRFLGPLYANKKKITLNVKTERGKEILRELLKDADVLVQNMSFGAMDRLGFGYEEVKKLNPRLVYCSISGYGQTGPMAAQKAYDPVVQALTGIMHMNGFPEREPVRVGTHLMDYVAGLYAALGVMYALHAREHVTGEGQLVDCAMFDGGISFMQEIIASSLSTGQSAMRKGNRSLIAVCGLYKTAENKYIYLTSQTAEQFNKLMTLAGRPDYVEKNWSLSERVSHMDEIDSVLGAWLETLPQKEAEAILKEAGIACSPVLDVLEMAALPQTQAREMLVTLPDLDGEIDGILGVVPKLSDTPGRQLWGWTPDGACNQEIYGGLLHLSEEELEALRQDGII